MPTPRVPLPLVRLQATRPPDDSSDSVTGQLQLAISRQPVQVEVSVSAGPIDIINLFPIFQGMAEVIVGIAVQNVEDQGLEISCRKGCGACCRQMVPISEMEARHLAGLVEAMPEPRRSVVRQRFAKARERLDRAELESQYQVSATPDKSQLTTIGLAYFELAIACPFLEEESCSIHLDRPLACREYLVTSPAEACSRPAAETIRMVPIAAKVSQAARILERQARQTSVEWMPLINSLDWVARNPQQHPKQPGVALVQGFFKNLAGEPPG